MGQMAKVKMPEEFKQLGQLAQGLIKQTAAPRKLMLNQMTEALRTGGVHAQIPMIQQAVSRANQATAGSMAQTAEQLASTHAANSPFAQRILAGQRLAGNQMAAGIPTQMAQQLIQQSTPFLASTQGLGFGGLAQTGQTALSVDAFNAQQFKAAMEDIKSSLQTFAAACLHPNAPIETPDGEQAAVSTLEIGDRVWSLDEHGHRIIAKVVEVGRRYVGPLHSMICTNGFIVTPAHPLPDGSPVAKLGGESILSGIAGTTATYDIKVDGPTGVYFIRGLALGSTLDPRHREQVAA